LDKKNELQLKCIVDEFRNVPELCETSSQVQLVDLLGHKFAMAQLVLLDMKSVPAY
jgi:hypothetical protein